MTDRLTSLWRTRVEAGPQPSRPAKTTTRVPYGVRVRHTNQPDSGAWAAYIATLRRRKLLNATEFARRIHVDRGTVHRWESGKMGARDPQVLDRIAAEFTLPPEEVYAAAGLFPGTDGPVIAPSVEPDPEIELILTSNLPGPAKDELVRLLLAERETDRQRRMERMGVLIDLASRRRSS